MSEEPMSDPHKTPVRIQRNSNDPLCMRASIGGFVGEGFYCQVRYGPEGGKPEDLIAMLERVLFALRMSAPHLSGGKGVEYKD
jgi:hypothetical protein